MSGWYDLKLAFLYIYFSCRLCLVIELSKGFRFLDISCTFEQMHFGLLPVNLQLMYKLT